jgi:hypothetical protein
MFSILNTELKTIFIRSIIKISAGRQNRALHCGASISNNVTANECKMQISIVAVTNSVCIRGLVHRTPVVLTCHVSAVDWILSWKRYSVSSCNCILPICIQLGALHPISGLSMDDESAPPSDFADPADADLGINSPKVKPKRRDSYSPTTGRGVASVGQGGAKIYEYCQVSGIRIHYRLRRSADPECKDVIYLFHGFLSHMFTWEHIFDELAESTGLNVLGAFPLHD